MTKFSWLGYGFSFLCIGAALAIGWLLKATQIPQDIVISLDPNQEGSSLFHPTSLTAEQLEMYKQEGFVFVPGLLSTQEAINLRESGEYAMSRRLALASLFSRDRYKNLGFDLWRTSPEVASLSLQGLPSIVAPIMEQDDNSKDEAGDVRFRLLRDAMFQYEKGGMGCGWHVDDVGFWPAHPDTSGPTIWIALDEMKKSEGGGLALFHRTKFAASTTTDPSNTITEEFCRQVIKKGTCDMEKLSPECHSKMEESRLEWDMQPGDAIIWDRWTFHRGVKTIPTKDDNDNAANQGSNVKRRFSVRYAPHTAKALGMVHPSVEQGSSFDSPYYPQVWPSLIESEVEALKHGLEDDLGLLRIAGFMFRVMKKEIKVRLGVEPALL